MGPSSPSLQFEAIDRVGLMTLQRPEKRNGLDDALMPSSAHSTDSTGRIASFLQGGDTSPADR